jgi:hypothetical protein
MELLLTSKRKMMKICSNEWIWVVEIRIWAPPLMEISF